MKYILIILTLFLVGCESPEKREGELIGTMSVYRTDRGFVVVSDQNGDSMVVNFDIQRVIIKKKVEPSK
jgi:hypothetical protein